MRAVIEPNATTTTIPDILCLTASEPLRYRRVRLLCGPLVLSEAENWYVPQRLTPAMNDLLDRTDMPFGKAAAGLAFERHTVSSTLLFSPEACATNDGRLAIPERLFCNRAILTLGQDRLAFAELVETYRRDLLYAAA